MGNVENNLRRKIDAHAKYDANPNYCKECGCKIEIPLDKKVSVHRVKVFCSHSCSTRHANKNGYIHHRRTFGPRPTKQRYCPECGKAVTPNSHSGLCRDCADRRFLMRTKRELADQRNSARMSRFEIGRISRRSYKKSGRPMTCAVCGYSVHVEVCHIRDVASFPAEATIAEINDMSNLVALCPNHHWELDIGLLKLQEHK